MTPKSLEIFEKRKGIYISPENIIAISWTILIFLIHYLKHSFEFYFNGWDAVILIFWLIYIIGLLISTFFRYQREIGKYNGKLIFQENQIQLNDEVYKISEIAKLDFVHAYDIRGMFVNHLIEFAPHLSNGLDNELFLILKNGEKIKCNFLQTESERLKHYKEMLTHYHRKGIIDWLQLLNLLEIQDYDKIQKFKKEISNTNTAE